MDGTENTGYTLSSTTKSNKGRKKEVDVENVEELSDSCIHKSLPKLLDKACDVTTDESLKSSSVSNQPSPTFTISTVEDGSSSENEVVLFSTSSDGEGWKQICKSKCKKFNRKPFVNEYDQHSQSNSSSIVGTKNQHSWFAKYFQVKVLPPNNETEINTNTRHQDREVSVSLNMDSYQSPLVNSSSEDMVRSTVPPPVAQRSRIRTRRRPQYANITQELNKTVIYLVLIISGILLIILLLSCLKLFANDKTT